MKKIIVILLLVVSLPVLASDSTGTIVEKFNASFPNAVNVKWYNNWDNTEVYYENAGIISHIWYDRNGDVIKTRRYYSEKDLSPFLKTKLMQQYPGNSIFGITETGNEYGLIYYVTLHDDKTWTQVKCDGTADMVVFKRFKKCK
ncbi:MAG: hypothetical protein ABWZ25_11235 [Chitinophagaceae bacterium]